ncbi:MAG TPA: hypothetical protein VN962_22475 [Polyangia bacterium]|nr:hypothetical protein [Polyangia bacterium]
MGGNKRGAVATILLAGVLTLGVGLRFLGRVPQRPPRRAAAAPYVHPIVPSTPVVHPAPPACRAPDLLGATAAVRQVGARAAGACRDEAATRARIDALGAAVSGCVARDAELDSEWNLVQAAVLELRACTDCAVPRGKHCDRVSQLLAEAEKGAR